MKNTTYDIIIIGAGFAGLTLAHHLPPNLKILVVERKNKLDCAYESTGLVTITTKNLLADFLPKLDHFLTNNINTLTLIAPDFKTYFSSSTPKPWIFSTDTPQLIKYMGQNLGPNVTLLTHTLFQKITHHSNQTITLKLSQNKHSLTIKTRFLVGADGGHSHVAQTANLSQNQRFLFGYEKLFLGEILLGENPHANVYHYWFGEFSLGYGGWLSPTTVNGKKAFRIGLAKLQQNAHNQKLNLFIQKLTKLKHIKIQSEVNHYAGYIPINGPLKNIYRNNVLLIGDAAGFCGAFAADGIKGAIVSAKTAAQLIPKHFESPQKQIFKNFHREMNQSQNIITYFHKQKFYRFIWNQMRHNNTFWALYKTIAHEKKIFIQQFSDAKNSGSSLQKILLKPKILPQLLIYTLHWLKDFSGL